MKILQTADNHIGETAYSKIDSATGLNARGIDFLNSFKKVCDIALEKRADVLLVVGDFFTRVNPHPRYVYEVMGALKSLSKSGITTIVVGGNHEAPRLATTLNPLKLLEHIDNVYCVLEPDTINVDGLDFVCVPSPSNFDEIKYVFKPMLDLALQKSSPGTKVLAVHTPMTGAITSSERVIEFFMGETVDTSQVPTNFAYVALGHIHRFQRLKDSRMPMYYSGSSERCDFSEEGERKCCILIEVEEGTSPNVTPIELPTRKMLTVIDKDCSGLSAAEITLAVLEAVEVEASHIKDSLVRVKLDNIHVDESKYINWAKIREALDEAEAFDVRPQPRTVVPADRGTRLEAEYVFPPSRELELYLRDKQYSKNRRELLRLGRNVIKEAEETLKSET